MINLIHGDSLDKLQDLAENSVDTIITDPPYGLSFMGKKWDYDVPSVELWRETLRVLKPGGTALIFAGSRTSHRMAVNVEDAGFTIKDTIMWLYGSGFPKATDISKQLDKGHEREQIPNPKAKQQTQSKNGIYSDYEATGNITPYPVTPEAKLWNGWKSHGLKPSYEPIIVAMKPNDGTYANNALKHGVSGLNIDGGRIENNGKSTARERNIAIQGGNFKAGEFKTDGVTAGGHSQGRFPANIILDEEAGELLDEQSGELKSGVAGKKSKGYGVADIDRKFGEGKADTIPDEGYGFNDKGGASRFFYCAKSSKSERTHGGTITNGHPTIKPLKLMEYLVKLTATPTGGTVLDPFMGSGTTGLACKNQGRDFIGIEREAEYIEIAKNRINSA